MKKIVILGMLAIAGCAQAPAVIPVPAVSYQKPRPVAMKPVLWHVYNKNNIQKLQTDLAANGGAIIALTPQGYKNLSSNFLDLQRFIGEQNVVRVFLIKEMNQRSGQPR